MTAKTYILSFLFIFLVFLQEGFSQLGIEDFTHYSLDQGLSKSAVRFIEKDKEGWIWIAHADGVDKFDGKHFFKIPFKGEESEEITYLHCKERRLVAADNGLFEIKNDTIARINPELKDIIHIELVDSTYHLFSIDTLYTWNQEVKLRKYELDVSIKKIISTEIPMTYLVFDGEYISRIQVNLHAKPAVKKIVKDSEVNTLYLKDSLLYAGKENLDIQTFLWRDDTLTRVRRIIPKRQKNKITSFNPSNVTAIFQDSLEQLWIGSKDKGIYIKEDTTNQANKIAATNYQQVNTIKEFGDGIIWIGTETEGLYVYQPKRLHFKNIFTGIRLDTTERIPTTTTYANQAVSLTIASQKRGKRLFIGTDYGRIAAISIDKDKKEDYWLDPYDNEDRKETRMIYDLYNVDSLYKGRSRLLIGTSDGLFFHRSEIVNSHYSRTKFRERITTLGYDHSSDKIWAANDRSNLIYLIKNRIELDTTLRIDTLTVLQQEGVSHIYCLEQERGRIFLVGTDNGLFRIGENNTAERIGFNNKKVHFLDIQVGSDYLWVVRNKHEIVKLSYPCEEGQTCNELQVFNDRTLQFFPDGHIHSLVEDSNRNIWFSTDNGLFQLNPLDSIINHYGEDHGINNREFKQSAIAVENDQQQFYFGGTNGVTIVPSLTESVDTITKKELLLKLVSISSDLPNEGKFVSSKNVADTSITLSKYFNYIDISATFLDYTDPTNHQFRIKIDTTYFYFDKSDHLRITDDMLQSGKNQLSFEYRDTNTKWKSGGDITIDRATYSREELISGLAILALLLFLSLLALTLSYYRRIAAYRKSKLAVKEKENTTQQKVIKLVKDENTDLEKLTDIQKAINEVSRQEDTETLIQLAVEDIVEKFKYDIAIVSQVDFFKRKIHSTAIASNNLLTEDQKKSWKKTSRYSLDEKEDQKDILNHVIRVKRTVKVVGEYIYDDEIVRAGGQLNPKILDVYDRIQLSSLFIPIIHRTLRYSDKEAMEVDKNDSPEESDIVLGVIEVAKILDTLPTENQDKEQLEKDDSSRKLDIDQIQLELYVDNFAQPYYRAYEREKTEELKKIAEEKISEDIDIDVAYYVDHKEYIKEVLKQTTERMHANFANIAFSSFNHKAINVVEDGLFINYPDIQLIKKKVKEYKSRTLKDKSIVHHVSTISKPYLVKNVKEDLFYFKIEDSIESELGLPLFDDYGNLVCVAVFSSNYKNFFNKLHIACLTEVLSEAIDIYLKKKRYNSLAELTTYHSLFSLDHLDIYKYTFRSLDQYFKADSIAVWKRESPDKPKFKLLHSQGDELNEKIHAINFERFDITSKFEHKKKKIRFRDIDKFGDNTDHRIYHLCKELKFQSWIILSVIIEQNIESLIYVFSKRQIKDNPYRIKLLTQVAEKTAQDTQGVNLVRSINDISKSFHDERNDATVKMIVKRAFELLKADSVVFFKKRPHDTIRMKDAEYIGSYLGRHNDDGEKKANMANWVITNKENKYFTSKEEYNRFYKKEIKHTHTDSTFWDAYHLKAVAAVLLEYEGRPLGMMIFNFTNQKNFENQEERRMIESFTNLVAVALKNEDYLEDIREERRALEQEQKEAENRLNNLEKEFKSLELEYTDTYTKYKEAHEKYEVTKTKLDEMIPNVTRASFWYILQGVNHDLRNFLISVDSMFVQLKNNASSYSKKDGKLIYTISSKIEYNLEAIEHLLELINFQSDPKYIIISDVIDNIIHFFREKNIEITYDEIGKIPELFCVKAEISMAIYNVVNNAVQALEDSKKEKPAIKISSQFKDSYYIIIIEDNGPGIHSGIKDQIFELGFSAKKAKGLGIGLYFVNELITEKYKGEISVHSQVNKNTIFKIKIPK